MKHLYMRIISLLLAALIIIGCGGCSSGREGVAVYEPIEASVDLVPLSANDDDLLSDNPDRGFRTEFLILLKKTQGTEERANRTVYVDESEEQIRADIQSIFDIYIYSKPIKPKLSLAYIYITDWRREELSEDVFRFLDIYFQMCREQKIKNMLRFAYCDSHEALDRCADEQTIIRHVKQLRDIISKNADTIHTIETGFVGSYGEWATVYQEPPVDYATVIKAIVEHLAVPNNLFFSIGPIHKHNIEKDYEYYWSISHNNDAMFGYQNNGWKSFEPGTPEWTNLEYEGAYTPQGGEMHTNYTMLNNNTVPNGFEMIMQCYYHHQTSMSVWHGYMEALGKDNVMQRWIDNEVVTAARLDAKGIIYDPAWFLNDDGETVKRNPYEFIRDYLGYKLVAQQMNVCWSGNSGDKINIDMSLINYGFSAAFNLESGFALLDSEGNVISEVTAGEPQKWYNRNPEDPYSSNVLTHSISALLDAPKKAGEYKIAFYLRNTMGTYARLSNKLDTTNGYNILYTLQVK